MIRCPPITAHLLHELVGGERGVPDPGPAQVEAGDGAERHHDDHHQAARWDQGPCHPGAAPAARQYSGHCMAQIKQVLLMFECNASLAYACLTASFIRSFSLNSTKYRII